MKKKKKNNLKKKIIVLLAFIILGIASFCLFNLKSKMSDSKIINSVVDNFMLLTKVPRPSHHEEKISAYLVSWARNKGLNPIKDNFNNVMFDVKATKGMKNKPLVILQGHMDMVVAVRDGKSFDPLNDPITILKEL